MPIPKPLTPEQVKMRDAVGVMAGKVLCKNCRGTGQGMQIQFDKIVEGRVYHSQRVCYYCRGERYTYEDEVPF